MKPRTKQIEVNGAKITVREPDGWSGVDADTVRRKMILALGEYNEKDEVFAVDELTARRISQFTEMVTLTEKVDGKLGFPWPDAGATSDELMKAYEAIGSKLKASEVRVWVDAINDIQLPPGDPALQPGADPNA